MDADQPMDSSAAKSKRPNQALYVPKKHQQGSKDRAQATEGVKPRPRPRYTDKSRKNVKNRKDKTAAAGGAEERRDADVKKEELQQEAEARVTSDPSSLQVEPASEEQAADESWDTLFDDDGDFLDPHLLEEVRVRHLAAGPGTGDHSETQQRGCPINSLVFFCAKLIKQLFDSFF